MARGPHEPAPGPRLDRLLVPEGGWTYDGEDAGLPGGGDQTGLDGRHCVGEDLNDTAGDGSPEGTSGVDEISRRGGNAYGIPGNDTLLENSGHDHPVGAGSGSIIGDEMIGDPIWQQGIGPSGSTFVSGGT